MGIRSRVMVLAVSQILATPTAFGSVIFSPVGAMICLAISYIFAEMWFGILFAILVEIVPLKVRSTTVGIFLFFMNNIGGNLPILVEPLSKSIGYREALYILYAGFYGISSILFLFTLCLMDGPTSAEGPGTNPNKHLNGVDNVVFTTADERSLPTVTSMISNSRRPTIGDSRL
ncbi:hypothetical protein WA026_000212 [Henosepilachna vigintioctopunctata]|uniref:Major facilitator superfamily (MFS) profile domain-containing protein n=1 Tax=Henosepilachna vigintioctopunctata TaxID=420089 RepID=A0AAW1V7L5_9CUCU